MPPSLNEMPSPLTDTQEMRLDFLGIGSQKSGTTSLNAYLRDHPQIRLIGGEAHFFDNEKDPWPPPNWDSYHSRVPAADDNQGGVPVRGEITPIYLYWQPCLERIRDYNPEIRLILLLRNPVDRAYSHWAMETRAGKESLGFSEAIRSEDERLDQSPQKQHRVYSYAARGLYHAQLERLLQLFPRKQLLIIKSEEFFRNPERAMGEVHQFLNVQTVATANKHHCRPGHYSSPMGKDDWYYLYTKLGSDIEKLEVLLGWDCSDWKRPNRELAGNG